MTVYLHREPVDFRKQINGLSVLVQNDLSMNPFDPSLYVFSNRNRRQIKLLYWARNGFCLWQKRLEEDRFPWPREDEREVITVTEQELTWLLSGINLFAIKSHPPRLYDAVG
jgi:transposase